MSDRSPLIGLVDHPKSEPEKVRAILEYGAFFKCEYPSGGLSSFKSPLGRIII